MQTQHTQQQALAQIVQAHSANKRAAAQLLRNAQAMQALAQALTLVRTARSYAQLSCAYGTAAQQLARSIGDVVMHALAQRVLANYVQFAVAF